MLIKTVGALAASTALVVAVPATATAGSADTGADTSTASASTVSYSGLAFGTQVSALDKTITSGRTAPSSISCTTDGNKRTTKDVAGVNLPGVGKVGAVSSVARTTETSSYKRMNTQANVAGVNLLGGRITADAIKVNSSAYARDGRDDTGVNSFSFVNLKVGDTKIPVNVKKNSKVTVPGVAEVTLNQQSKGANKDGRYTARTNGIVVRLLKDNPLGLPTDTKITIASARASVDPVAGSALHAGSGFSTRVRALDGVVRSSPTASVGMPCLGGHRRNNVAEVNVPLLINSGTTTTTATGASKGDRTWSRVINRTASPRILGGLISADAIVADTTVSRTGDETSMKDRSSLVGLRVAGRKVADVDLEPNSTIEIPGIAKVTVHKQSKGKDALTVTMLRVELLSGTAGLPKGAVVEVGHSRSQLK